MPYVRELPVNPLRFPWKGSAGSHPARLTAREFAVLSLRRLKLWLFPSPRESTVVTNPVRSVTPVSGVGVGGWQGCLAMSLLGQNTRKDFLMEE